MDVSEDSEVKELHVESEFILFVCVFVFCESCEMRQLLKLKTKGRHTHTTQRM